MSIRVGEVIAVNGVKITLRIDEASSKDTLFYQGEKFRGVSIREYVGIQRGFRTIVCMIEGEYLDEAKATSSGGKELFIRRIEAKPVGYFESDVFVQGIKYMPMIRDAATLMPESQIGKIFGRGEKAPVIIGKTLKEDIPVGLPWTRLFNSHIGVFGNTGSGKSNTLAMIYSVLFTKKATAMSGKSKFVLLDFNGEYTGAQLVDQQRKHVYKLSTQSTPGDRIPITDGEFWDVETLAVLFQATQNTQRPFLNRLVDGKKRYEQYPSSLTNFTKSTFKAVFSAARQKPEMLDLLRRISIIIESETTEEILRTISWHSQQAKFFVAGTTTYFDTEIQYENYLSSAVGTIDASGLDAFDELLLRSHLQLVRDLVYGFVQFDHIQPLLKRVESSLGTLRKVIYIGLDNAEERLLTVVSMKKCNIEARKVIPLLLAKHYYNRQRESVGQPVDRTVHLIIDEAHNILSQQSTREQESWKDYRLELFEEIVKEGRKFGFFLTVSSQRPADIAATVVSQLHNFFIHRLVNDRDLSLIDNTITTLDSLSKSLIPGLAQGCCVATGTAFDIPLVLQVNRLEGLLRPDSEDVDLAALWGQEP